MGHSNEVAVLLIDIEAHLRQMNLWEDQHPSAEALASSQPFHVDTLSFTQWLQFVFLPTLHGLIETEQILPAECGISPMAEEYFSGLGLAAGALERTLLSIDRVLSRPR
jgi:uncharacterized protein YqcC (DUF446 family)